MKKISLFSISVVFILALIFTSKYALRYMHWSTKARGYPGLYEQTDNYSFLPADSNLINAQWELLAVDLKADGDILNWPDAKELHVYKGSDTIWLAYSLYNDININEPMVSIALEEESGKDWYGTVAMKYKEIITAGYYRKGDAYFGYNFLGQTKGVCTFRYSLATNTLYMGIPMENALDFRGKRFVASVGFKSYWNDDYDALLDFDLLLEK